MLLSCANFAGVVFTVVSEDTRSETEDDEANDAEFDNDDKRAGADERAVGGGANPPTVAEPRQRELGLSAQREGIAVPSGTLVTAIEVGVGVDPVALAAKEGEAKDSAKRAQSTRNAIGGFLAMTAPLFFDEGCIGESEGVLLALGPELSVFESTVGSGSRCKLLSVELGCKLKGWKVMACLRSCSSPRLQVATNVTGLGVT